MPADEMQLRDEDRLPWLETVEADDRDRGSPARTVALVVLGLVLLAGIVFAVARLTGREGGEGDGQLIAAQEGDYKVRPEEPGGLRVEGEGDAAIATSAGKGAGNGAIDLAAVPEAPVAAARTATPTPRPTAAAGRNAVAQVPPSGGRLVAAAPMTAPRASGGGASAGGSLVQLGAFPSEGAANTAWTSFSKRFGYLAALGKSVQPVEINGKTLYRLRVNAGSAGQATDICGRLKVAGESCFVAS